MAGPWSHLRRIEHDTVTSSPCKAGSLLAGLGFSKVLDAKADVLFYIINIYIYHSICVYI
jgi:hypothetical protein